MDIVQLQNLNCCYDAALNYELAKAGIERWKRIDEFPNYYVSNLGRAYNSKTKRVLKADITEDGHMQFTFYTHGTRHRHKASRLVMSVFIGTSELQVDHISENKQDNRLCNLRYLTCVDNIRAYHEKRNRWFSGYYDGELIGRWLFQIDAARELNIDYTSIYKCLHGIINSTHGFTFSYDE